METSDSEYFESADEDLSSDEEPKSVPVVENQFKTIQISDQSNTLNSVVEDDKNDKNRSKTPKDIGENTNEKSVKEQAKETHEEFKKLEKVEVNVVVQKQEKECTEAENLNKIKIQVGKDIKCEVPVEKDVTEHDSNDNQEENLWGGDGWEIEEEINIPKVEKTILDTNDPLNTPEENMWDNGDWEDVDEPQSQQNVDTSLNTQSNKTNADSWSSWGNWGVSTLLSSATQGVSTITNQVSHGLSSVLETGMGIPSPEEMAKMNYQEEKIHKTVSEKSMGNSVNLETDSHRNPVGFGFGNFVSGVSNITRFVETTGTKVISGGLETLETIGKKTMEVLQDGDPGLKKKRAFLKLEQEKPVLSQVLREAKEKAEQEMIENQKQSSQLVKKVNYESLFDDNCGLVHLEALEMVSKQCELKLRTLCDNCSGDALVEIQETLDQIKELCELPDEDEDEQLSLEEIKEKLQLAIKDINVNVTYEKLIASWEDAERWLENVKITICSEEELHQQAIETLAQLTALAVEQYHKAGELLLIKDHHSTADEADSLVQLTTTLTSLIGIVAAKFSDKLNLMLSSRGEYGKDNINNLITNVFFEASNSSSYIQDAFQLLIPVLQVGAI